MNTLLFYIFIHHYVESVDNMRKSALKRRTQPSINLNCLQRQLFIHSPILLLFIAMGMMQL